MKATINAVCYKSKTLKNGEHPIILRVCKQGNMKYLSLGISINPKFWDFKKNEPKPSCPDRELIQKIILDKKAEYQTQILELKATNKDFTASSLILYTEKSVIIKTVEEFYNEIITYLTSIGKIGNSKAYNYSYCSIKRFLNSDKLDFLFSEINIDWLNRYDKWLTAQEVADTSKSVLFRTLRSLFNKAIEQRIVKREDYPFNSFKTSRFNTKTKKRSITKEDIKMIISLNLSDESELVQLSRDIFLFSYLQSGMNFTDIANLKYENIQQGRIEYTRQKTHKPINIPILKESQDILDKYNLGDIDLDIYVFPILDNRIHKTQIQKHNRIHKMLSHVNKHLKTIGKLAKIDAPLTTYVARHTFATVLKRSGVNTSIISESLGHSSEKVTPIYLDSFENSQMEEAMKNLL